MTGFVYFILNPEAHAVKIGYAKNVKTRFSDIGVSSPHRLKLCGAAAGTRENETTLHGLLRDRRMSGEWFRWDLITHEMIERVGAGATIDELIDFATPDKLFTRLRPAPTGRLTKQIEEAYA